MEEKESEISKAVREAVVKAAEKGEKRRWLRLPVMPLRRH